MWNDVRVPPVRPAWVLFATVSARRPPATSRPRPCGEAVTARELLRSVAAKLEQHEGLCGDGDGVCGCFDAAALRTLAARLDEEFELSVEMMAGEHCGWEEGHGAFVCLERLDAPIDPAAPCGTCGGSGL